MKKNIIIFLMGVISISCSLSARQIELNTSYDYFRGLSDGSWNGNSGIVISANVNGALTECFDGQIGCSYGLYNWDGHENLVFASRRMEQIGFITAGISSSFRDYNIGLVYDHMLTDHFGIYAASPSMGQLRFQVGYPFCCREEVGIWATAHLGTSHESALGVPLKFRSVNQCNVFWTHQFNEYAKSSVWLGLPYSHSLRFPHKTAGTFIAGFFLRAQLTDCLSVEGGGSYMNARHISGEVPSRNYAANICLGITYSFPYKNGNCNGPYMPLASHSSFIVDTNLNQ